MSERPRRVRTAEPMRRQGVIRFEMPEDVAADHSARLIWRVLGRSTCRRSRRRRRRDGRAGRDVLSPTMMLTLWLYAISIGLGARERSLAERSRTRPSAGSWATIRSGTRRCRLSRRPLDRAREADDDVLGSCCTGTCLSLSPLRGAGRNARSGQRIGPSFRREATLLECRSKRRCT